MFKKINFFSKNFFKKKRNIIALGLIIVLAVFSVYYVLSQYDKEVFPPNQKLKNQISIQTPKLVSVTNKMKESSIAKVPITKTIQNKFKELSNVKPPKLVNTTQFLFDYTSGITRYIVNMIKEPLNQYLALYSPVFSYAFLIGAIAFAFLFLRKIFDEPILVIIIALNLGFIFVLFLQIVSILWYLPVLALTILFLVFKKYGSI